MRGASSGAAIDPPSRVSTARRFKCVGDDITFLHGWFLLDGSGKGPFDNRSVARRPAPQKMTSSRGATSSWRLEGWATGYMVRDARLRGLLTMRDVGNRSPDGAQRNPGLTRRRPRIARSLSSGAHSRDPLAPSGLQPLSPLSSDLPVGRFVDRAVESYF